MNIKCGAYEIELDKEDIIFDNSFCFQITTKEVGKAWHKHSPVIAKTKAKKLIKDGVLELVSEEFKYTTTDGKDVWYKYYKLAE